MGEQLELRRKTTRERLEALQGKLTAAAALAEGKACVYVTGSFGRGEASPYSDLDLFIVGRTTGEGENARRVLGRLDEICIKADLIEATRSLGIKDFDGDGEYLDHYTVDALIKTLGHPEDDVSNTFTARMLMLLESKPLFGDDVYWEAVEKVLDSYWQDYADHKSDFVPAFLANDVLRMWRTFCVNYEARTAREPEIKKAKRKLKNYKLKHARLFTCYSALAYLLAVFGAKNTVAPTDARDMVKLDPITRLDALVRDFGCDETKVEKLVNIYETFLTNTDAPEADLVAKFIEPAFGKRLFAEASEFGNAMWELLESVGKNSRLHRLMMV